MSSYPRNNRQQSGSTPSNPYAQGQPAFANNSFGVNNATFNPPLSFRGAYGNAQYQFPPPLPMRPQGLMAPPRMPGNQVMGVSPMSGGSFNSGNAAPMSMQTQISMTSGQIPNIPAMGYSTMNIGSYDFQTTGPTPMQTPVLMTAPRMPVSQITGLQLMGGIQFGSGTAFPAHQMPITPLQLEYKQAPLAFDHIAIPPFEDAPARFVPTDFGVIRIKNIPYQVTQDEIRHFLGRQCHLIEPNVEGTPIHIIMERSTAKTMDCYIEVKTVFDAQSVFQRHESLIACGRHPKLGIRHVTVEVSTQDELLADLFPRTKSLIWRDGMPIRLENTDPYSDGFSGFFTQEEMVGLVRHAENPARSPFCQKCLQRTYECMISTLYKMPWFATDLYTYGARNLLFDTYLCQLKVLVEKVEESVTVGLTLNLLLDFLFAGVNCPGFGERQKYEIVRVAENCGGGVDLSPSSSFWPFDLVGLRKDSRMKDDVVRFYLHLIEQGVQEIVENHDFTEENPSPFPYADLITFKLPSEQRQDGPITVTNTHFSFTEAANDWPYGALVNIEMDLMQTVLETGWTRWQAKQMGVSLYGIGDKRRIRPEEGDDQLSAASENDVGDGPSGISRHPLEVPEIGAVPSSPPQSPRGTVAADLEAMIETPHRIIDSTASMSARQPSVSQIDPTSTPFRPRRQLSDPAVSTQAIASEGTLGFGLGDLGNGSFSSITAIAQRRANDNRSGHGGAENDGDVFESAGPAFPSVPRAFSIPWTSFTRPARRSAAVSIKNPDGTLAELDFIKASIRDDSELESDRGLVSMNDDPVHKFSPPKAPRAMRRRSDSGPRPTGQSSNFNIAVGTSPTKTPNRSRKPVSIASTIHEESEGEHHFGHAKQEEDSDDEVIMSGGRRRQGAFTPPA